jgi:hypothetical protein
MRQTAFGAVSGALGRLGYDVVARDRPLPIPVDCDEPTRVVIEAVRPYTLTTPERIMALCGAVRHVHTAALPGAIVECGVWRGGSMMAIAMTLVELGVTDRDLYMFDTFTEMPLPDSDDDHVTAGPLAEGAADWLQDPVFAFLPLEQVRANLEATGYPPERLHFVQGLVEDTIPSQAPEQVALCRLDTDWYRSTAHEMQHLYPRITAGGVLLIDDYGEFLGARRAVDEALEADGRPVLMHRVDASCRLVVAPG